MQRVLAWVVLCCAACGEAPEPLCRDPNTVVIEEVSRVSSCDEDIEQDINTCRHTRGSFDRDTCVVDATYVCSGGVLASVSYVFPADGPAGGLKTYRRIEDGCRIDVMMAEPE